MRPTATPILLGVMSTLLPACGNQSSQPPTTPATTQSPHSSAPDRSTLPPDLPPRFTDHVPQYQRVRQPNGEDELVADDPVPFDMILIPGDPELDIAPFYLGETEVTWAMVRQWMYCQDILDYEEIARLISEGLRPTPIHGWVAVEVGVNEPTYPVVTATRLTCESFCLWLTEKTGRRYRLPTPGEWALALHMGGGCPESREQLLATAVVQENAPFEDYDYFGPFDRDDPANLRYITNAPIRTLAPNQLGIYDMLGNAGEWVVEPSGVARVVGGYFAVPAEEISADWSDTENHDVWNAYYPQRPNSRFWYYGEHHFQGFRLVCEVEESSGRVLD